MVHLDAGGQGAVFDLYKIADVAAFGELAAWPQLGKGPHRAVGADAGPPQHRMQHLAALAELAVFNQAARADAATVADAAGSAEVALGFHHHIAAKAGGLAEAAAGRIGEGHPLGHPVAAQPLLQHRFALAELEPVVDAGDLVGIGHLEVHGRAEQGHRVGEVELTLVVVAAELGQRGRQLLPVEAVDARIGEVVEALLVAAVAVLHDGADGAGGVGKDPAVAARIGQPGAQ